MNKAVQDAIREVVDDMNETPEFKRRFHRLLELIMEKPLEHSHLDDDIIDVLELVDLTKERIG